MDLNVEGASCNPAWSYTFTRIAACGQTRAHLLHWMHNSDSHTGISNAIFRFSHCAVPTGNVPSTGNALTGNMSPSPAMILAVTFLTNAVALSETTGGI